MPAKRAAYHDKTEPVQNRLFRSLRVWSMYADLEESLGTFEVESKLSLGHDFVMSSTSFMLSVNQGCVQQNHRFENCNTSNHYQLCNVPGGEQLL